MSRKMVGGKIAVITSQITGHTEVMRLRKRRPPKCSAVRKICAACLVKSIHPNDAQHTSGVCFACASLGLRPASGLLVARRSATATPKVSNMGKSSTLTPGNGEGEAGQGGISADLVRLLARAERNARTPYLRRFVGSIRKQLFLYGTMTAKQSSLLHDVAEGTLKRRPRTPSPAVPVPAVTRVSRGIES